MTPTTEAGRADHAAAWDAAWLAEDWPIAHVRDREHCPGCDHIARIEAEAAAKERARIRAAVEALRKLDDRNVVVRRQDVLAAIEGASE